MTDLDTLYLLAFQVEICRLDREGVPLDLKRQIESLSVEELHNLCLLLDPETEDYLVDRLPPCLQNALLVKAAQSLYDKGIRLNF